MCRIKAGWEGHCMREVGCLKYLKREWNRKERGTKILEGEGGKLGQGVGALRRGGLEPTCEWWLLGRFIYKKIVCLQLRDSEIAAQLNNLQESVFSFKLLKEEVRQSKCFFFCVLDFNQRPYESNQTRYKKGESSICKEFISIQRLYMELWCFTTGSKFIL